MALIRKAAGVHWFGNLAVKHAAVVLSHLSKCRYQFTTVCGQRSLQHDRPVHCALQPGSSPVCPTVHSNLGSSPVVPHCALQPGELSCVPHSCFPGPSSCSCWNHPVFGTVASLETPALPANVCSLHTSFTALPHTRPGCHPLPPGGQLQLMASFSQACYLSLDIMVYLRQLMSTKLFINELHKPPLCSQHLATIPHLNVNPNINTCSNVCICLPCLGQSQVKCPHGLQCM